MLSRAVSASRASEKGQRRAEDTKSREARDERTQGGAHDARRTRHPFSHSRVSRLRSSSLSFDTVNPLHPHPTTWRQSISHASSLARSTSVYVSSMRLRMGYKY